MKRTDTHRHTDTQTHRHTDTQTHRHTNTDTQTHRHTDTQTFTDTCGCAVCHAHRLKSRKQNTWLSCLKLTASMQRPTSTSNKRLRFACDCILVYFSTCGCFRCSLCCLLLLSPGPLSHTHAHSYRLSNHAQNAVKRTSWLWSARRRFCSSLNLDSTWQKAHIHRERREAHRHTHATTIQQTVTYTLHEG